MSVWRRTMFKTEGGVLVPLGKPMMEPLRMNNNDLEDTTRTTAIETFMKKQKRKRRKKRALMQPEPKVRTFAEKIYNINENNKEFTDILKLWEVLFQDGEDMQIDVVLKVLKIQMLLREAQS